MIHIAQDSLATIYFSFMWESSHANHVENYLAQDVSFTRDILPLGVKSRMLGLGEGDSVTLIMDPSEVPLFKPGKVLDMPAPRFQPPLINGRTIRPRIGRFYPKNYIEDVPGTRPDSATPFRVVETDKGGFKANLNHPMAGRAVTIKATVVSVREEGDDRGVLHRWSETFLGGPGMQARLEETPTDFLGAEPFKRQDESDDMDFYTQPRLSHFQDKQARENVQMFYAQLLGSDMDILNIRPGMSTILPEGLQPNSVTGLGMNMAVMEKNPVLTDRVVHDVNANPALPFEDGRFDAAICTDAVEYFTRPAELFEEVARVLRPGGVFGLCFSNKWYEEKVIQVWTELAEFERLGLVSQHFVRTEKFKEIHTWSERGWPCMESEMSDECTASAPVYGVWGVRR